MHLYNAFVPPPNHLPNANSKLKRPAFSDTRVEYCAIGQGASVVLQMWSQSSVRDGEMIRCYGGCKGFDWVLEAGLSNASTSSIGTTSFERNSLSKCKAEMCFLSLPWSADRPAWGR
jgi:hypothetical protein